MILGSCVSATLSDRLASKSVTSITGLFGLKAGKAVVIVSISKLEAFLEKALWSRNGIDILEDEDRTAIVNKAFALESDDGAS